jgi:hypothetical protein
MSVRWEAASGTSLFFALLFAAFGGTYIPKAMRLASAARNEKTATTDHLFIQHRAIGPMFEIILHGFRTDEYVCSYEFSVDETSYRGNDECTELGDNNRGKERSDDAAGTIPGANLTVHYNSFNPSMNSLLELSAASEREYRGAVFWISLGVLGFFSAIFGLVLESTKGKGKAGQVVDFTRTVIYPEEIDFGLGSDGLFGKERKAGRSYGQTANRKNGNAADSAPSPTLRELYLEVVNSIHPDRAANEADLGLRERLMKEANAAFERGDAETLRKVLEEYRSAIPAS